MSTTQSGRLVIPQNFAVPTLHDIAIQSGRIVRFTGACRVHWTVLHHLMVCLHLVNLLRDYRASEIARTRLIALLHDGEEVATSDVPALWKTAEHKRLCDPLQTRIYEMYLGETPTADERVFNKMVDRLALLAEMLVVGPPHVLAHSGMWAYQPVYEAMLIQAPWVTGTWPGGVSALEAGQAIVNDVVRAAPSWVNTMDGTGSSMVRWYLRELQMNGVRNLYDENLFLNDAGPTVVVRA